MDIKTCFDARADFGAIGNGQTHPLKWRFKNIESAREVYPHAISIDDEQDWAAIQGAFLAAWKHVRETLARGPGAGIHRTGTSFSPPVYIPPGVYMINRPVKVYPHTSAYGSCWGHTQLQLTNWLPDAEPMNTNPQGIMWNGPTKKSSAIFWLLGDVEWPVSSGLKVAGMVNSFHDLGFKCHDGPGIFIGSNQNQLTIRDCWFNGYGDGPSGLSIVANITDSSTQITNLFLHHCQIEGCKAGPVLDRVMVGEISNLQIDTCGGGIYVGTADAVNIDNNKITCCLPTPKGPFLNGIWVGLALSSSISNNIIKGVTKSAIKVLGRGTSISGNKITMSNSSQLTKGYGIHIVGPSQQFGGNMAELRSQNGPYIIDGNCFDYDTAPPASLSPVFLDADPGTKILARGSDVPVEPVSPASIS